MNSACMSWRSRGFALAEVLVALAVLAMMGAMTAGTFSRTMLAKEQAQEITGHYRDVRQAVQRMTRELSMAYLTEHRDCDDARSRSLFRGERDGSSYRVDFTTFAHTRTVQDANESDQAEISYYIDTHPSGEGKVLFRRIQAPVDEDPEKGGTSQVLSTAIQSLEMRFFDERDDSWDSEWDSTRSEQRRRLPMYVELTATAKAPSGEDEEFLTRTRVFLRNPIRIFGTGAAVCSDD